MFVSVCFEIIPVLCHPFGGLMHAVSALLPSTSSLATSGDTRLAPSSPHPFRYHRESDTLIVSFLPQDTVRRTLVSVECLSLLHGRRGPMSQFLGRPCITGVEFHSISTLVQAAGLSPHSLFSLALLLERIMRHPQHTFAWSKQEQRHVMSRLNEPSLMIELARVCR